MRRRLLDLICCPDCHRDLVLSATKEDGDEIVFAHEVGSWMISGDEKPYLAAYLSSLAAVTTPDVFTATVLPLLRRDRAHSDIGQVSAVASRVANKEQSAALQAAVKRQKLNTTRKY